MLLYQELVPLVLEIVASEERVDFHADDLASMYYGEDKAIGPGLIEDVLKALGPLRREFEKQDVSCVLVTDRFFFEYKCACPEEENLQRGCVAGVAGTDGGTQAATGIHIVVSKEDPLWKTTFKQESRVWMGGAKGNIAKANIEVEADRIDLEGIKQLVSGTGIARIRREIERIEPDENHLIESDED